MEWKVEQIDSRVWEAMDRHLCRLARQFKATHRGRKMEVVVSAYRWDYVLKPILAEWLKSGGPMPKLKEEANVVVKYRTTGD
jgi:hypothetical protein